MIEDDEDDEDEKKQTCRQKMAYLTVSPKNFYKMTWDLLLGLIYLCCYWIDPFVICFNFEPLEISNGLNNTQNLLTVVLIADMILVPLSAIKKKQ